MSDFNVRADSVNVEQIMEQIRARILEKRGVDYTEQQIRELAAVKLEKFLDPRGVRSDLLERFKARPAEEPPKLPKYSFEDDTIFETHRAPIRWIRKLLHPLLKLLFNPNPLIQALHIQARLNAINIERENAREKSRRDMDQLYYELIHNLVIETTRTGIEVKNLKMRVESMASRLEFNERRARALEGVVAYRPTEADDPPAPRPSAQPRRQSSTPGPPPSRPAPSQPSHRAAPISSTAPAASPTPAVVQGPQPAAGQAQGTTPGQGPTEGQGQTPGPGQTQGPGVPGEGPGQRSRRRRRRRGRRSGGAASAVMAAPGSAAPAAIGDAPESADAVDQLDAMDQSDEDGPQETGAQAATAVEPVEPAATVSAERREDESLPEQPEPPHAEPRAEASAEPAPMRATAVEPMPVTAAPVEPVPMTAVPVVEPAPAASVEPTPLPPAVVAPAPTASAALAPPEPGATPAPALPAAPDRADSDPQ